MDFTSLLLTAIIMVFVYRQSSGKANYNKWLIFVLALSTLLPSLLVSIIGWHQNPRRAKGDKWTTALDGNE